MVAGDYEKFFKKDSSLKRYGALKHEMNVMVVDRVSIEPRQKVLFVESAKENFVLDLKNGSGHFKVYQFVDGQRTMILETHEALREVSFRPVKAGKYEFEVVDLMFEDISATTEVLIRELTLVKLHGSKTHVEKDGQIEVDIRGYDTDGSELDLSLFKMKFELMAQRDSSF